MQDYKEYFLSNGIKVLYFNFPFMKSTEVMMFLKGGALFENESQIGLSHFLEHILFTGTKKFSHRLDLRESIKQTGGSINGNTSKEQWNYPIKVTDQYIDLSFEVLSELLGNALLRKEDIEHEKDIIKEELQRTIDKPSDYLGRSIMPKTIFQNVALKRPLEKEIDNINKISQEMVFDFYKTFYNANNMLLTICSSSPIERLLKKAEKHLGKIKQGNQPTQIKEKTPVENRTLFVQRDINQSIFSFGTETFGINDHRQYQAKIATHILSSVLFEKLREKQGLTYTANVFNRFYKDTGAIYSIIPTNKNKLPVTVKTTLACIENLKTEIKETYFSKAKNVILSNLLFEEEKPSVFSFNVAYQSLYKEKVQSTEDKIQAINTVTKEDIFNIMNEYFVKGKVGFSFLGDIDNKTMAEINKLL